MSYVKWRIINSFVAVPASALIIYIEAIAGSSRKDFTNFLSYSLKSANESKFCLALLRDSNNGDKNKINTLLQELTEMAKLLGSSIRTLRSK